MKGLIAHYIALFVILTYGLLNNSAIAAQNAKVILVHGAFSDGSSWSKVIPLLQEEGIHVVAVQNPLTSLSDDVATTKRMIEATEGPIVLVGHSYAGAVITEAGNSDKVKALVYVAAFAPDHGQAVFDLGTNLPPAPGTIGLTPDKFGFYRLKTESVLQNLAPDLPEQQAYVMAATQTPTSTKAFNAKVSSKPAWKDKTNFYVVATNDRMIQPELERHFAKTMNATTIELPSSHVAMLSHPKEVADLIIKAVNSIK